MKIPVVILCTPMIALGVTLPVSAVALCAKQRSDGTFNSSVRIREACKAREAQLDPPALVLQGSDGPPGPVGKACCPRKEA